MKILIIFNKNQENLNLLLESLQKHILGNNEIVIFDQNNLLTNLDPIYKKITVNSLKNDIINEIELSINYNNFMIIDENKFCYDDVDIQLIDKCLEKEEIFCFGLSLGKNVTFCANLNCDNVFLPEKIEDQIVYWNWSVHYMDFGYPLNLDGTVFRKKELLKFLKNINFENSLELENNLQIFDNYPKEQMCCFEKSKIIEIIFENKSEFSIFNINDIKIDRSKFVIKSKTKNETLDQISN